MRVTIGFMLTIFLGVFYYFSLSAVADEVRDLQTIPEVLDERVQLEEIELPQTSYLHDQNSEVFAQIQPVENRIYLEYEQIPSIVIDAFIATEDRFFYEHKGFDMAGITRALMTNVQSDDIEQGGSTITQQLVRHLYLTHEQTYERKLSELMYAYQLETELDKDEILELYINTIYFQHGVYGFETASEYYFGRSSEELSIAEIAFLSAIPNNPSHYDPLSNMDHTLERRDWVLHRMYEEQVIDEEEYMTAKEETIELDVTETADAFPGYVTYIKHEFKRLVSHVEGFDQRLNEAESARERIDIEQELDQRVGEIYDRGIIIETYLDPAIQEKAKDSVSSHLQEQEIEGTAVVIDHEQQEIKALLGGKDYEEDNFHRAFQAYRQPGSAIKPLLVYGPFVDQTGSTAQQTVNADNFCRNGYCPQNFGGGEYGQVTLETAFKHSYNTPAVRLLDQTGIHTAFSYFEKLPFARLSEEDYALPAALGGFTNGVSPLELTQGYTVFGQNGSFQPSTGIKSVTDLDGHTLYEWDFESESIWEVSTNDQLRHMLHKVITEGTGQDAYLSASYIGGKTGTTDQFHDLWFVGLTDTHTTGVWIGEDQPANLSHIYGEGRPVAIWKDIMSYLVQ